MDNRSFTRWLVGACLVLGALLVFAAASVANKPADETTLYADVTGRVVDDTTGQPLAGIEVSLLYESVTTNEEGRFLFPNIPLIHSAEVSLRVSTDDGVIIGCTVFDVPVKFYPISASTGDKVVVEVVEPGVDTELELRLKPVTIEEVGDYCDNCHGQNPCVETASFQEVLDAGKDMRGIIVKESVLERFREQLMEKGLSRDSYRSLRYQDTHPDGMDMHEKVNATGIYAGQFQHTETLKMRLVKEEGVEHRYVECDTCHTRHVPTEQRQFVIMDFEEDSTLCYQCHK